MTSNDRTGLDPGYLFPNFAPAVGTNKRLVVTENSVPGYIFSAPSAVGFGRVLVPGWNLRVRRNELAHVEHTNSSSFRPEFWHPGTKAKS